MSEQELPSRRLYMTTKSKSAQSSRAARFLLLSWRQGFIGDETMITAVAVTDAR